MSEPADPTPPAESDELEDETDLPLGDAAAHLRGQAAGLDAARVVARSLGRSRRRARLAAAGALAATLVLGGVVLAGNGGGRSDSVQRTTRAGTSSVDGAGDPALSSSDPAVIQTLRGLPAAPVDPTQVQLTAQVQSFAGCDELLARLRRVGAEHVGSQGFGQHFGGPQPMAVEARAAASAPVSAPASDSAGQTLGTNVQVAGVDEPDRVKTSGALLIDLADNSIRVTDTAAGRQLSSLDLDSGDGGRRQASVQNLLLAGTTAVVFGSENVIADPLPGDPSATRPARQFATLTWVDLSDPAHPKVGRRIRLQGEVVNARLVRNEVRLVLGSDLAGIGFVMPTSPESVSKALDVNRRSVAASNIANWVPSWDTGAGSTPEPLVPCDQVHIPETFAGVSMTSMLAFGATDAAFTPRGAALLAPSTDLYADESTVYIASHVWVDPADQTRLTFQHWQTAVHRFDFADGSATPGYRGSAAVDGSISGQFAFGAIGDMIGVVASTGVPWSQPASTDATLHVLRADVDRLVEVGTLEHLNTKSVSAVRFTPTRVLVSGDGTVRIIDLSDPARPRMAGQASVPGAIEYFQPIDDGRVLAFGNELQDGRNRVRVGVIDATVADTPVWNERWSQSNAGSTWADHHSILWWPERGLAGFPLTRWNAGTPLPSAAMLVGATPGAPQAMVEAQPVDGTTQCTVLERHDADGTPGSQTTARVECAAGTPHWVGWSCFEERLWAVDQPNSTGPRKFACSRSLPLVDRVLLIDGRIWLHTPWSLQPVDPSTLVSGPPIPIA
jgi:hypothetical protein